MGQIQEKEEKPMDIAVAVLFFQLMKPVDQQVPNDVVSVVVRYNRENGYTHYEATKKNGEKFEVWFGTFTYMLKIGDRPVINYRNIDGSLPVTPKMFSPQFYRGVMTPDHDLDLFYWLGHVYALKEEYKDVDTVPKDTLELQLPTDLIIGTDAPITKPIQERIDAGQTLFNIAWFDEMDVAEKPVWYIGVWPEKMLWPETLFRPNFLGLGGCYLDEPAVRAIGKVRAMVKKHPRMAKRLSPHLVYSFTKRGIEQEVATGRPHGFVDTMRTRKDIDLGDIDEAQRNMWTWEVVPESAHLQLGQEGAPSAFVWECRLSAKRMLTRLNTTMATNFDVNNKAAAYDPYFDTMADAAWESRKDWGISIYGQMDKDDIEFALKRAYDKGSSYFLFWTGDRDHDVPYAEQLKWSKCISDYAKEHPERQLPAVADKLIYIPQGYQLFSPAMWGFPEFDSKNLNRCGVPYGDIQATIAKTMEQIQEAGYTCALTWRQIRDSREAYVIREDGMVD